MSKHQIQDVNLDGQKIEKSLFISVGGTDKMFIFFESGEILELPIHRECPVHTYTRQEFESEGREKLTEHIEKQRAAMMAEASQTIRILREL